MSGWFSLIFRYKEKRSPDKLGKFPVNIHTQAFPERRYLWTSRCLVVCAAISCSLTIMLALTIFLLLPQRGALPLLLERGGIRQTLKETALSEITVDDLDLIEESAMRNYVTARHSFLPSFKKATQNWTNGSAFQKLSSQEEYGNFTQTMNFNFVSKLVKSGLSRKVIIKQAKKLNTNLWMIQFSTVSSTSKNPEPIIEHWKAYISFIRNMTASKDNVSYENPLSISVTKYNLSYLGKEEDAVSYLQKAKELSIKKIEN